MQTFTASWFTPLPDTIQRIGISRGVPRAGKGGRGYRIMRELAPGPWFLSASPSEYVQRYYDEILAPLDAKTVRNRLLALSEGRDVALLCFEKVPFKMSSNWCHRKLAASWLEQALGDEVPEFLPPGTEVGDAVPTSSGSPPDWPRDHAARRPRLTFTEPAGRRFGSGPSSQKSNPLMPLNGPGATTGA